MCTAGHGGDALALAHHRIRVRVRVRVPLARRVLRLWLRLRGIVDAPGAPLPVAMTAAVKPLVLVVADPGPRGKRADAEPDETGGSADHHEGAPVDVVLVVVVVPKSVGVWHIRVSSAESSSRVLRY